MGNRRLLLLVSLELKGILLGDKGYLSKAKTEALAARGLKLLTPSRKNMKHIELRTPQENELLSRRGLIEHSRHRSVNNFMVNIMAAVVAYCLNPNKPTFKNIITN